jgi:hypothetical protein
MLSDIIVKGVYREWPVVKVSVCVVPEIDDVYLFSRFLSFCFVLGLIYCCY